MPRYDFECQACRKPFELRATVSEYAAQQKGKSIGCPACGSKTVVRVFSPPGVLSGASARRGSGPCCPGGTCG